LLALVGFWDDVLVADPIPDAVGARTSTGGWSDAEQIGWYLGRIDGLEPRRAGEQVLLEALPAFPKRVLDLGCGDGRLAALVLDNRASVESVLAVENSVPMLELARERFRSEPRVAVERHDLVEDVCGLGAADVIVSPYRRKLRRCLGNPTLGATWKPASAKPWHASPRVFTSWHIRLPSDPVFLDVESPVTHQFLREELALGLSTAGVQDLAVAKLFGLQVF
jgi:SAM-dependent methyltransferase